MSVPECHSGISLNVSTHQPRPTRFSLGVSRRKKISHSNKRESGAVLDGPAKRSYYQKQTFRPSLSLSQAHMGIQVKSLLFLIRNSNVANSSKYFHIFQGQAHKRRQDSFLPTLPSKAAGGNLYVRVPLRRLTDPFRCKPKSRQVEPSFAVANQLPQ